MTTVKIYAVTGDRVTDIEAITITLPPNADAPEVYNAVRDTFRMDDTRRNIKAALFLEAYANHDFTEVKS